MSEDPVFWSTKQNLENPQSLNSYSYGNGNPITNKDPNGKVGVAAAIPVMYGLGELGAGATIEFWGPPVVVGVGAAAIAIGAYSLTQKYTSGNSSYHASNNPYPGPGMSYEIYQ